MKIMDQGVAFASATNIGRQSLISPSVCVLESGRWLAGCRAAPRKAEMAGQHALISWSGDEGQSWSTPLAPLDPPEVDGRPGLFRTANLTALGGKRVLAVLNWVDHSDPSLPMFNEDTQGLLDFKIFLARSDDAGETWSTPQLVDTSPFNQPTPLTGPILQCKNGDWALQIELNNHYYDRSEWRHKSVLMYSRDEGQTWPEYSIAGSHPENRVFYWDQRPAVLPDGTVLDLFWTYDNHAAKYLNIHARESNDNGRAWSEMWDTGVPGQPAPPVALPDGRLLMVHVDRDRTPRIKARLSEDGGRSWPEETALLLYELRLENQTKNKDSMPDAWSEMEKFSLGLPTTTMLPNGDVLVLFYAGSHTDQTEIRWMRIAI